MTRRGLLTTLLLVPLAALVACSDAGPPGPPATAEAESGTPIVDGARIIAADAAPGEWLTHGRTYGE